MPDVTPSPVRVAPRAGIALLLRHAGLTCWLDESTTMLYVLADATHPALAAFHGTGIIVDGQILLRGPLSPANARAVRRALPWLQPRPLGLRTSAGFGDRLGLATPGHIRALRACGATLAPIFAQQSIRENTRTGRTPQQVLDDATWGALAAGWQEPVGADADHLKTTDDIDACVAAGFTTFTLDPGAHVDSAAASDDRATIERKVAALPWEALACAPSDLRARYVGRTIDLGTGQLTLCEADVLRAAAKYGRAIAHLGALHRHLAATGVPFELEISVDETDTPTTPAEHCFLALELRRLGVPWVSLAPRFVGRFEKGVDYQGDLAALQADLAAHAAIARALGPYKLSLHSGSDKFSVYPLIAAATGGLVHLKTAGTSYLEALRVVAGIAPDCFRQIAALARERYAEDRQTYHVSARLDRMPDPAHLSDHALPALLDQFDARQILHVTFGAALASFGAELRALLATHRERYAEALERHFVRHLQPFITDAPVAPPPGP
ncbi:MAG: tagaturonate epimerase family protein [Chloroflexi bacterium OHK40]